MAQHKASKQRTLESAMKHRKGAEEWLRVVDELNEKIAEVKAKVAADADGTWDTDYVTTGGVTELDWDVALEGQHRQPLRKIVIETMAHKKLGNLIADMLEEAQVTLNAVLTQMDADAGTLSDDATYEALRIANVIEPDAKGFGAQHDATLRQTMRSAISQRKLADELIDALKGIQDGLNEIINDVQAANA